MRIGLQRIAAIGYKSKHLVKLLARGVGIGHGADDFGIEIVSMERSAAGDAEDMLGQHIEPATPERGAIQPVLFDFGLRRDTFQIFEPVCRHKNGTAGLVQPVVGPADPLQQAAHPFGRADLNHQIDISPVEPEIERACRHHTIKAAGSHQCLDLAAQLTLQRAVMHRNPQILLVQLPQALEYEFSLRAGIDENDAHPRRLDLGVDLVKCVPRHMA